MHGYPEGIVLEDAPCPNQCAQDDRLVMEGYDRLHSIPGKFRVVECRKCGLMRTNPRPTRDTIGIYYPSDYRPHRAADGDSEPSPSATKRWFRQLLGFESRGMPKDPPGRLLEIGCASGAFIEEMRKAGWTVEGIEFSERAAIAARMKGLKVQIASVESATAPAEPVDVVAAWMVLEHLHDPVSALKTVRRWVRRDGYLIASVPDADCLLRRLSGARSYDLQLPTHLYHYTLRTLEAVLRHAGWNIARVSWQRNCNTLLWTAAYLAREKNWDSLLHLADWLRTAKAAGKLRAALGWVLGLTRQSGRIEIWATPA